MALTLYSDGFYISPYVFSVFIALEEKGVPYQLATVALQDKAHERPEYRDRAITGRVPAIDHDGFWLAESAAIDNYLDDAFPFPQYRRALPESIQDRARASAPARLPSVDRAERWLVYGRRRLAAPTSRPQLLQS